MGKVKPILPYQNARRDVDGNDRPIYKLHGDAKYELRYETEKNIIFDSDQYTQSLTASANQSMRECFAAAYREFNLLFVGCSLKNEPDIRYIFNNISDERFDVMSIMLKTEKVEPQEAENLEDYGITHIILVDDYDLFYLKFTQAVKQLYGKETVEAYPFTNPSVEVVKDDDLKYFSGFRSFDENNNSFLKSDLMIERDELAELELAMKCSPIVFLEGRRFSGKTTLLCTLCEHEKKRTIFFFPSTTQVDLDVILTLLREYRDSLLIFDSNSLSYKAYHAFKEVTDILLSNNNCAVIAFNQSDTYLPEHVDSGYIKIKNRFSAAELKRLKPRSDAHALINRLSRNSNLDYLNQIEKEQNVSILWNLNLPSRYTRNEQILLILLGVKDKVYSRDILTSLQISFKEVESFLSRVSILCEWVCTVKGETKTYSAYKLVHNSKNIILEQVRKIEHDDIIESIITIVKTFKSGDENQKRIYREVMQFDTLNQLFGRKKGAGKLISDVYGKLEELLNNDLHFWLQRSKSIYRLSPRNYRMLEKSYSYAKKVYVDSKNETLTTKAALSVSLICGLLSKLDKNQNKRFEHINESIYLGYEAIFSEYYKQEKRLNSDLNTDDKRNNYADLMRESCNFYVEKIHRDDELNNQAVQILRKLNRN